MKDIEYILCAAIWYKDLEVSEPHRGAIPFNCDVGVVVCGWRHSNCIWVTKCLSGLRTVTFGPNSVGETVQGFLTNKNRFVDREEGGKIAFDAGQIEDETDYLFSENLY